MQPLEWYHIAYLILAVVIEIIANILLKLSDGFRRKGYGILSLLGILAAFSALAQAVKGMDLTVAYALWGGFGIAATAVAGGILFNQKVHPRGWFGLLLLIAGMVLIKFA
ncbi:MAG: multidrug/spermidine efflux SMR transporter subunit MdtI [Enterobacteriaceae bacterium]